jgi:alpha-amylase/alpha-mannosidase (GH57 family)
MIVTLSEVFGNHSFDLQHLFAEERHRIMQYVTQETQQRLDQLYLQVYRDNYSILAAFHRDELPIPKELQVAAEIAISHRCSLVIEGLAAVMEDPLGMSKQIAELSAIASEAKALNCQLSVPKGKPTLERLIFQRLLDILANDEPETLEMQLQQMISMIEMGQQLNLGLSLDKVQEHYYYYLDQQVIPSSNHFNSEIISQLCSLLGLGKP